MIEKAGWISKPEKRLLSGLEEIPHEPTAKEKNHFKFRERPLPSDWIKKNMSAVEGSAKATGIISVDRYQHTWGIVDTAGEPFVRETYISKVAQSAGSWAAEAMLIYWAIWDCVTCGLFYPGEGDCERRFKNNIRPQLKSRRLKKYLTGRDDDLTLKNITLQNTGRILPGWLSSTSHVKSTSLQRALIDECASIDDGYNDKNEADIWSMLDTRFNDCRDSYKTIWPSTPNVFGGKITQLFIRAEAVFDFFPLCPDCGKFQHMTHEHVKNDDGFEDMNRRNKLKSCFYVCNCGSAWNDTIRWAAIKNGEWFARKTGWIKLDDEGRPCGIRDTGDYEYQHDERPRPIYLAEERPATCGFHVDDFIIGPKPLWGYVDAHLRAERSPEKMQALYNQHKALPYTRKPKARPIHDLMNRADDRPPKVLPGGNKISLLLLSIDVQDNELFWGVYAFGWGVDRTGKRIASDWPSIYLIDYGRTPTTTAEVIDGKVKKIKLSLSDAIKPLEDEIYVTEDGVQWWASGVVIDSGGHRTFEVYQYVMEDPYYRKAYKGMEIKADGKGREDYGPGYKIPYRLKQNLHNMVDLHEFDQHSLQWLVDDAISKPIYQPGALHLNSGTNPDFARHFSGVVFDEHDRKWKKSRKHDWRDCLMMGLGAAIHIFRVSHIERVKWISQAAGEFEEIKQNIDQGHCLSR